MPRFLISLNYIERTDKEMPPQNYLGPTLNRFFPTKKFQMKTRFNPWSQWR